MKMLLITIYALLSFAMPAFAQNSERGREDRNDKNKEMIKLVPDDGERFIVPVIFHVLYNNNEENIPDQQLLAVLESLQNDFLGVNTDISNVPEEFRDKIGNPNIKFVLAKTLPSGNPTTGVIRQTTKEGSFNRKKNKMFYESPIIDSSKYLNVYICDVNTGAYYPNSTNPALDGIVIDYLNANAKSRTITHEVGHWLDLYHIYGDDGCDTDYVDDTPEQKMHWFYCPTYPSSSCDSKSVMFMNFMDYSNCRHFFTKGQVERMRQYILTEKPLLQSE